MLSTKYPDAYVLSMTYDAMKRLKTDGSYATVSYTVDDQVAKIIYGNGEVTTYTYDSRMGYTGRIIVLPLVRLLYIDTYQPAE